MLQSEPRSGDGAAIGYTEKNVISSFYSVVCRNVHRNIMKRTTKPRRIGGNRKRQLSTNVDKKKLETKFSISISRPTGDKWHSKTLVVAISDPRSSIGKSVFDCRLCGVKTKLFLTET